MTKDEALKLALEAMTYADACLKKQLTTKGKHQYAQALLLEAGTAIKESLADTSPNFNCKSVQARLATAWGYVKAQPEQEPVAWYRDEDGIRIYYETKCWDDAIPLYTAPQRTWVGLTDEEVESLQRLAIDPVDANGWGFLNRERFAYLIEIKLKEKNVICKN